MEDIGKQSTRTLLIGLFFLILTLFIGTVGYCFIEEYSIVDAYYMTVITISTVGYGEVHELSELGRLFTSFLIFASLGNIAYLGSMFVRFIVEGELIAYLKTNRVNKKILKLTDHVIICGFGRNGEQACMELMDHQQDFVIIEKRENVIERLRLNPNLLYIRGDATQEEVLEAAGISRAIAMITTTPNDADNVFTVLTARGINPDIKIISRASEFGSGEKLRRAGATNIIMPERMGGQRMAKLVMQPDVVEFMEYILLQKNQDVTLEEVSCKNLSSSFAGKSIIELRKADYSGVNIIGVRKNDGSYEFNPDNEYKLLSEDQLFVLGRKEQLSLFRSLLLSGLTNTLSPVD